MIRPNVRPHGQVRQSQVVTTFGPGSLLDLPKQSVIVGGLDFWIGVSEEVHEPRLAEKIKRLLNLPALKLFAPPPDNEDPTAPRTGITAWQFPEWFITQDVERGVQTRSRLLVHRKALTKGKFIDADRRKRPVVPIRFVRACRKGHVGDIDWYGLVHRGQSPCRRQLWVEERGTSGDLGEITLRCECGLERRLKDATVVGVLGHCDGSRPWLGPYTKESCDELNRLLVRHASNAYFPQIMSVISLPDRNETLEKAVNQVWENFLQYVDTLEELKKERQKKPPVKAALEGFSDDEVMQEIEARQGMGDEAPIRSVKQAEFEVLTTAKDEVGQDTPDGDFFARSLPKSAWDKPWMASVERVVLVHRLREVVAQLGFTRFEASSPDVEGELQMGVVTAPLARELSWLPAVENRGEGVFIQFRKAAILEWAARPEVVERGRRLRAGFESWLQEHPHSRREFPGLPYHLLHSLSHLLLTALSLECGYPASSLRERVYALEAGYGILLYTGSPDAEGTLGGLIETGRQIERHLQAALELGRLCSNDPVCAQHDPQNLHECRFLHGAACHGCLLIAEPSCEQHNDFLDRALVVPTVEDIGAEFFSTALS
ncbi:MAG: DrmB family protein [Gemmataceae bacterium]